MIIGELGLYSERNNGNKYLFFASKDENQEVLTKYKNLWDVIKYLIKTKYTVTE